MTFDDIRLQCYERLGFASTPAAAVSTRIGRSINRWHRKILSAPAFRSFRRVQVPQASVANTWDYGIALAEIYHITERTNDRRLTKRTEDWWRQHYPDPTADTGTPTGWCPLGYTRAQRRPANASEIFVGSTDAGDTGTAYVEVVRSDGQPRSLSVTMTGTTFVSLSTAITDVVDLVDCFLSAAAVGTVTFREDSGTGTILSTIPIGAAYQRYLRYALIPTPSAAVTYYLDGMADMVDFAQATDQPKIPLDFHDILVEGAIYDDWLYHGRLKEAQWIRDEINKRIMELRMWVWMQQVQGESDEPRRPTPQEELTLPIT